MDFSSLRSYPAPRRAWPGWRIPAADGPSPRAARVLFDLAALAGVAAALYGAWWAADRVEHARAAAEPTPLDFRVVAKRYADVRLRASRDDVERLLGPPTRQLSREDHRFDRLEALAEWVALVNRGVPEPHYWCLWEGPQDEGRWVAVYLGAGKVYHKTSEGLAP
jgi:hypothetical protein